MCKCSLSLQVCPLLFPDGASKLSQLSWEEWHEHYYGDKAQAERREKERQFRKEQKEIHKL